MANLRLPKLPEGYQWTVEQEDGVVIVILWHGAKSYGLRRVVRQHPLIGYAKLKASAVTKRDIRRTAKKVYSDWVDEVQINEFVGTYSNEGKLV